MTTVKYIAQLKGVRELALHGAADAAWWRRHLAAEGLEPVEADGAATIVVTGLEARWLVWPFRDLSVAVVARRIDTGDAGVCLARAFNASSFLVFLESRWFRLPYSVRPVRLDWGGTVSMRLGHDELVAALAAREPGTKPEESGYTGPLFLPSGRDGRRWLMVRIRGRTFAFDFDGALDRFEVDAACTDPVLRGLRESGFRGVRWEVRQDATHERSKTFRARG